MGSWSSWAIQSNTREYFYGYMVSIQRVEPTDSGHPTWHYLVALPDEPKPDENHIHLKVKPTRNFINDGSVDWVLAAYKVDNVRVVNRRKLVEEINRVTGLNLQWQW